MTALSPARVPFGSLDSQRLLNLQNTKNRQNALAKSAPSLKRRAAPSPFDAEDFENIDPSSFNLSGKRTKNTDGSASSKFNITTPEKSGQFVLTNAPPSPDDRYNPIKPTASVNRIRTTRVPVSRLTKTKSADCSVAQKPYASPIGSSLTQAIPTPIKTSTPTSTPAGRSPKSKRIGILSRKRTASPFTRVKPPANKFANASPLSIDAALSGTIPSYNPTPVPSTTLTPIPAASSELLIPTLSSKPMCKDWFFDIHEDTLEDTLTNIMEFSTGVLDISDDETRRAERADKGKENIPPTLDTAIANVPTGNLTETTSIAEPTSAPANPPAKPRRNAVRHAKRSTNLYAPYRAPLADLPPADFVDAAVVAAENSSIKLGSVADRLVASGLKEVMSADDLPTPIVDEVEADKDIQIWESGSAADEAERAEREEEGVGLGSSRELKPDVAMS